MNITTPDAQIINIHGFRLKDRILPDDVSVTIMRDIERMARISHRSEEKQTEDSWIRLLSSVVVDRGDWSVVEHIVATVEFIVDRGITHELVRHRLFSFTQESTRFVNYEKKMPPSFICPEMLNAQGIIDPDWTLAIQQCEMSYRNLIKKGISPQIARSVFPNALASKIAITGNLRNWRHFLLMRTTKESHPQMREVTLPLLDQFQQAVPLLYTDIRGNQTQKNNLEMAR